MLQLVWNEYAYSIANNKNIFSTAYEYKYKM